ncbi:MAG: hypothetical protein PUF85_04615, partial [Firmicutes bacterium]|nr:hypothetical protein [Bacillota bacterium]
MDLNKLKQINDAIISLHDITDPFQLADTFLQHLSEIVDFDVAIWGFSDYLGDGDSMDTVLISSPYGREYDEKLRDELESHSRYDYLKWVYSRTESLVYRDSDLINSDIRANSFYYKDFLEKMGLIYACGVIIAHDNHPTASLALYKDAKCEDFSDDDMFTLEYFMPHLEIA